jgi:hypothetical protein
MSQLLATFGEDRIQRGGDTLSGLARSLSIVHPSIVEGINRARRRLGLPLIDTAGDPRARLVPTANGFRSVPSQETELRWAAERAALDERNKLDTKNRQTVPKPPPARLGSVRRQGERLRLLQAKAGRKVSSLQTLLKATRRADRQRRGISW